jgi:GxxExxY protein
MDRLSPLSLWQLFPYAVEDQNITKTRNSENTKFSHAGSHFRAFVLSTFRDKKGAESPMGHDFEELSSRIIEAAISVHKALGPGFLESIYENAMKVALRHRGIAFEAQKDVNVIFEDEEVGVHRLDLLVGQEIVVELKAVKALEDIHFAQVKSYLKATRLHVGLLMNFYAPTLVVKRIVL